MVCPLDGSTKIGIDNRKFMNGPTKAILKELILKLKINSINTYEIDVDYIVLLGTELVEKAVDNHMNLVHEYKH